MPAVGKASATLFERIACIKGERFIFTMARPRRIAPAARNLQPTAAASPTARP